MSPRTALPTPCGPGEQSRELPDLPASSTPGAPHRGEGLPVSKPELCADTLELRRAYPNRPLVRTRAPVKIVTDAPCAQQHRHVQSAGVDVLMQMRKLRCVMRFPGPNDVVKLAERGYEAAERVISLVPRIVVMVAEVEQILADTMTADPAPLVDPFRPTLDKLEPIAARMVATTSPDEVEAVVRLVDMMPEL